MGTHPIFESDFDCLTEKLVVEMAQESSNIVSLVSRPETSDPLDFSFLFLATMDDLNDSQPRESKYVKKTKDGKYRTTAIRLSNNIIVDLTGFGASMERLIEGCFEHLQSIDLSFNELNKIDEAILLFPNIRSLYLHGNQISNLNELNKLTKISKLRRLTLHGNPIETMPNYRPRVILLLQNLKSFDFSGITKNDRFVSQKLGLSGKRKKTAA